jgi:hypothetical protein
VLCERVPSRCSGLISDDRRVSPLSECGGTNTDCNVIRIRSVVFFNSNLPIIVTPHRAASFHHSSYQSHIKGKRPTIRMCLQSSLYCQRLNPTHYHWAMWLSYYHSIIGCYMLSLSDPTQTTPVYIVVSQYK